MVEYKQGFPIANMTTAKKMPISEEKNSGTVSRLIKTDVNVRAGIMAVAVPSGSEPLNKTNKIKHFWLSVFILFWLNAVNHII